VVRTVALSLIALLLMTRQSAAQDEGRAFIGGLFGVSTLSADGRSIVTDSDASVSLYKPENGLALNLFAGFHLAEYFSIQANWMWNRNDVALVSTLATVGRQGSAFYEQDRRTHQHVFDVDGLVYFRRRDSRIRPYLGTGVAVVHFVGTEVVRSIERGLVAPQRDLSSTHVGLRSHVGVDVRITHRSSFRYSFSETISGNPISPSLTPPAPRRLANFENFFGWLWKF
jgi:outer membrane protein W